MGLREARRGRSYEYRLRDWLRQHGYQAERNPLSGASAQLEEELGKYDVRASKGQIFLQIEAKKTSAQDKRIIKRSQLDKIQFDNDELYVFAFDRSDHYAIVSLDRYISLTRTTKTSSTEAADLCYGTRQIKTVRGKKQFTFHRKWLEGTRTLFYWPEVETYFVALLLAEFLKIREKYQQRASNEQEITTTEDPIELIKKCNQLQELLDFYQQKGEQLSFKQKRILFSKCERLEAGADNRVSNRFIASQEWWLSNDKKYLLTCPFCEKIITAADIKRDDGENKNGS